MALSKGDTATYAGLVAVAILEACEPFRKEAAMPPESHPFLSSQFWSYLPIALLSLVALIWLFRQIFHRHSSTDQRLAHHKDLVTQVVPSEVDATEGEAHDRLELFINDFLGEAYLAQDNLQMALLKRLCNNEKVLSLFGWAALTSAMEPRFHEAFEVIRGIKNSPMRQATVSDMIESIAALENDGYRRFWNQANDLAKAANVDLRTEPDLQPLWDECKRTHMALSQAYDLLKRESRFKGLYRPQFPSRWGDLLNA